MVRTGFIAPRFPAETSFRLFALEHRERIKRITRRAAYNSGTVPIMASEKPPREGAREVSYLILLFA